MNKSVIAIGSFVLGAVAGAVGTWYLVKTHYEELAQEEIDSVKEVFSKRMAERNTRLKGDSPVKSDISKKSDEQEPEEEKIQEAKKIIEYSKYSADPEEIERKVDNSLKPYIISPQEFGEFDDYDPIELTYFADKILVDDGMDPIENVDEIIGWESLNHFGEYEDDSVYVRNDRLRADYVVLRDPRTYEEAVPVGSSRKGVL